MLDALADVVTDTDESCACDAFGAEWSSLEEAHVLAENDRHVEVNVCGWWLKVLKVTNKINLQNEPKFILKYA